MTLPRQKNLDAWTQKIISDCGVYSIDKLILHGNICLDIGSNVGGFIIRWHRFFEKI